MLLSPTVHVGYLQHLRTQPSIGLFSIMMGVDMSIFPIYAATPPIKQVIDTLDLTTAIGKEKDR